MSGDDQSGNNSNTQAVVSGQEVSSSTNNKALRRYDSSEDIEFGRRYSHGGAAAADGGGWGVLAQLAFQSIGVVYGDLGTSPLYMFPGIFSNGIKHKDDILGVLYLLYRNWRGTFALYSLVCRHAKVGLLPSEEVEDQNISTFDNSAQRASKLKSKLEKSAFTKYLLFATMLGTSMLIGDGVLTPYRIVWTSVGILIFLFMIQRFGTDKVGYTFAPVLTVWFFFISAIGIYNIMHHDPLVIKAVNPKYIVEYFVRNKSDAWISLGGVVLCITGTEALFADVGHFSVKAIQISTFGLVYPSIIIAYIGQASYLRKNTSHVDMAFYASIPGPMYWPMFVIAVLASIIASQSLISATFSIIQQSLSLGCFPRVKVVNTSAKYPGQVYIPEINYLLMLACVFVTLGFRNTITIGNAYGIAVVSVMVLTSAYLVLIMILIWKTNALLVLRFDQGGYLPLAFAAFLMTIMYVWNDVHRKKYYFELQNKISPEQVKEIVEASRRLPGVAFFYSELVHGIPPIFKHYAENVPVIHSVLVFVSFKSLPISKVLSEERFLFRRVRPKDLQVFRCVVRYGYKDVVRNEEETLFERTLVESLKEFVKRDEEVVDE
ncbi:hypothetical protein MIMGU_mgv1a024800mg, partial [Erythranthe guttata]